MVFTVFPFFFIGWIKGGFKKVETQRIIVRKKEGLRPIELCFYESMWLKILDEKKTDPLDLSFCLNRGSW